MFLNMTTAVHLGTLGVFIFLLYHQLQLRKQRDILRLHLRAKATPRVVVDYPLSYVKRMAEALGISFHSQQSLNSGAPQRIKSDNLFRLLTGVSVDSLEYVKEDNKWGGWIFFLKLSGKEEVNPKLISLVEKDLGIKIEVSEFSHKGEKNESSTD